MVSQNAVHVGSATQEQLIYNGSHSVNFTYGRVDLVLRIITTIGIIEVKVPKFIFAVLANRFQPHIFLARWSHFFSSKS